MEQQFIFEALPQNTDELMAMPEYALATPFQAAALTVAALCRWETDPKASIDMLNALKGPRPLSPYEQSFLRERLAGKGYKPFSFFRGATPANDYTPDKPYVITVLDNPYSYTDEEYARLLIPSGGADTPRPITLRKRRDQWLLWDQALLADIRIPAKDDPWA